ncbi:MAG: hypothetical protein KGL44_13150 [Sphingomonadales bacterium]|nr:hypothetical protein [Sphingomonadales bacterium]
MPFATPAHAQAWLGQYAADLSYQHNKAKAEAACLAGVPPRADKAQRAARDGAALISALPLLSSSSTPKQLAAVFLMQGEGNGWRDGGGAAAATAPFSALGARLAFPAGARFVAQGFVTGNDAMSARGVWRLELPAPVAAATQQPAPAPARYAVSFAWAPVSLFGNGWRITRLRVLAPGEGDPPLGPYCHLPPDWP